MIAHFSSDWRLVDQIILYGKEYQSCGILCAKAFHQPVFDGFYGAGTDLHFLGNFLGGEFHADIFKHISFSFAERYLGIEGGDHFLRACDFFSKIRFTKLFR